MAKATAKPKQPVFLVVVDDSEEMHQALQFACGRALAGWPQWHSDANKPSCPR